MDDCRLPRLSISALADGEAAPMTREALDRHLLDCDDCAAYAADLVALDELVLSATARPTPDLTSDILVAVPVDPRGAREASRSRAFLAFAAVAQVILTVSTLLGDGLHVTRDLAAFELALAGALVYVAVRPRTAAGLLPVVAIVAAVGVIGGTVDALTGGASLPAELAHLLPVLAAYPLWQLSRHDPATPLRTSTT